MKIALYTALFAGLVVPQARADGSADLARRLEAFHSPGSLAADLHLDLHLERTLHHKTARGEATLTLEVEQDGAGLRVRWEPAVLRDADAESRERDQSPDRLTPVREALKELDPARLAHLLDQAGTLAGLTKGGAAEERAESWEGHEARRLVYRFQPRLSWTEAYYLRHSDGRLTIWIAADGTPLASESVATFDGKTSRMFGRFSGTTTVRTKYAADGERLRVAEREVDELTSHEDGGEAEHAVKRFAIAPRRGRP